MKILLFINLVIIACFCNSNTIAQVEININTNLYTIPINGKDKLFTTNAFHAEVVYTKPTIKPRLAISYLKAKHPLDILLPNTNFTLNSGTQNYAISFGADIYFIKNNLNNIYATTYLSINNYNSSYTQISSNKNNNNSVVIKTTDFNQTEGLEINPSLTEQLSYSYNLNNKLKIIANTSLNYYPISPSFTNSSNIIVNATDYYTIQTEFKMQKLQVLFGAGIGYVF